MPTFTLPAEPTWPNCCACCLGGLNRTTPGRHNGDRRAGRRRPATADPSPPAALAGGLGTRHAAAAGITASTDSVAVCVSQSTGTVSVYRSGRLLADIPRAAGGGRFSL